MGNTNFEVRKHQASRELAEKISQLCENNSEINELFKLTKEVLKLEYKEL